MMIRLFLLLLLISPADSRPEIPRHEEVRQVMGTLATVRCWSDEAPGAVEAANAAFAAFQVVDSLMSTWRDDSALSTLNQAAPGAWVDVGGPVVEVLTTAVEISRLSGGTYDPTVLPLVVLWGFRGGEVGRPLDEDLRACLDLVDYEALQIDPAGGRARLMRAGMSVDLGGIAKGYALDRAAEAMRNAGATGGYMDLGGNILVFGEGPAHEVGVLGPQGDQVLATLPLTDGSVATSGQYENFLMIDGVPHGHILDPRSGLPVPGGLSVTVLADRAMIADALATAAVVLGPKSGLRLLESQPGVEGVLFVRGEDGKTRILTTTGLIDSP